MTGQRVESDDITPSSEDLIDSDPTLDSCAKTRAKEHHPSIVSPENSLESPQQRVTGKSDKWTFIIQTYLKMSL